MRKIGLMLALACASSSAQVILPTLSCGQESALFSLNGDTPTSIQFVNTTTQPVRVYWRDYSGNRIFYNALDPGAAYVQATFLTHPWVITDTKDRCIAIYQPAATAGIARISVNGILLTQTGFTFQAVQGGPAPPPSSFGILDGSAGSVNVTVSASTISGGGWLSVSPTSGTVDSTRTPPSFRVAANPNGLAPGDYYGQVRIDSQAAVNTPQFLSIVLNILAANAPLAPSVQPIGQIFVTPGGGISPAAQSVHLAAVANHPSPFNVSATTASGGSWLSVTPASGILNPGQPMDLQVSVKAAGLASGAYQGSLAISFPQDNLVESVNVIVIVGAPSTVAPASVNSRAASTCKATKLLPTFTLLGSNLVAPVAWPAAIEVLVRDDCGNAMLTGSVEISFSNGDAPLTLGSHQDGFWSGTWVPGNPRTDTTRVTATARQPETNLTATVTLEGSVPDNPLAPSINAGGIVSAASYAANAAPSPGEIVSIFGNNMADGLAYPTKLPLDTQLASASLLIAGRLLPLVFTSTGQINAVIPFEVPVGATHQLILQRGTRLSVPQPVTILGAEPGVFTTDMSGKGQGHIYVIPDPTKQILADTSNPAKAGDVIIMYCSGLGPVSPSVTTGAATPSGELRRTVNLVTLTIGGVNARVDFAGLTPGFTSLYQVNAVVPVGVKPGTQTAVVLTIAGVSSAPVTIATR